MGYTGLGSDGQVLSIISGVPKWDDPSAGGGGGAGLGATVGPLPASYQTLEDALLSGNTVLHIIGDTIEGGQPQVSASGATIQFYNGAQIALGTLNIATNGNVKIHGNGTITYAYSDQTPLFAAAGVERINVSDITLINSASSGILSDGIGSKFYDINISGNVILNSTRTFLMSSYINGDLTIWASGTNCQVGDCGVEGLVSDFGNGSLLADIRLL